MPFTSLGLSQELLTAITANEFPEPTPIQRRVIPAIFKRKDILGIAKTGSGKTASYVLPILHQLSEASQETPSTYREPVVLVLVPTRELADQVQSVFIDFLPSLKQKIQSIAIYGGVSINTQMQQVGKAQIIIATPGRLIELVEKNAVRLSSIHTLVLDEADKMLNLGFKVEVDRILSFLPQKRQNLLFSATLSDDLNAIQKGLLHNPIIIKISSDEDDTELIHQVAYQVSDSEKGPLLRKLISEGHLYQVLVFASSTHRADGIVNKLLKHKIDAAAIHAKKSQSTRRDTLQEFKNGTLRVLVATDLLARGVDIDNLSCVVNYELPRSPKDYIHRIGRTGRAGHEGTAISLVSPEEEHHFRVIQKKMGKRVDIVQS
ncbi:MAG: DEAD/DEAH box helicase [Akkermansiaceae bacterium]